MTERFQAAYIEVVGPRQASDITDLPRVQLPACELFAEIGDRVAIGVDT